MIRAWATCFAAILVLGCQSGEEPVRGVQTDFEPPPFQPPPPGPPKQPIEAPTPKPPPPQIVRVEASGEEQAARLGRRAQGGAGHPKRLRSRFRSRQPDDDSNQRRRDCSANRNDHRTHRLRQPLIGRCSRLCIRQRVGMVVLKPLDDTVSSKVATVIEIKYEPPVIVESDPGVPEPQLRNVKEPLPKRPDIPPSGKPIQGGTDRPIKGGDAKDPTGPQGVPVTGPKPRAIDGYEVDESHAQQWR